MVREVPMIATRLSTILLIPITGGVIAPRPEVPGPELSGPVGISF